MNKQKNYFDQFTPVTSVTPSPTSAPKPSPTPGNYFDQFQEPSEVAKFGTKVAEKIGSIPGVQSVISTISPALNFLSRPSYASAKFADSMADESKSVFEAMLDGFSELTADSWLNPNKKQEKMSYSDVIRRRAPEFARNNPNATDIMGFVGDIALDPTSWLGVGTIKSGIAVGTKALTRTGGKVLKEGIDTASRVAFVGADNTIELLEKLPIVSQKAEKILDTAARLEKRLENTQVVDDVGRPKIVYRGTTAEEMKKRGGVTYYTEMPEVAASYRAGEEGATVLPVYLNIKNLANIDDAAPNKMIDRLRNEGLPVSQGDSISDVIRELRQVVDDPNPTAARDLAIQELKKEGIQGIEFWSDDGGVLHKQYMVFSQKNVQTAIGSRLVAAKAMVDNQSGVIGQKLKMTDELTTQGYFQSVANKKDEINNFIKELTGQDDFTLSEDFAKTETLADMQRLARDRMPGVLGELEVRERVEDRMLKVLSMQPDLKEKFFKPEGLYLKVGVPFGPQADLVRLMGFERLTNKVKAISSYLESSGKYGRKLVTAGATIAKAFNRDYGLPQEFIDFRNQIENRLGYITEQTLRDAYELFRGTGQEGIERVQRALMWSDDETRKLELIRAQSTDPSFRNLTDGEAAQIFQQGLEKFKLLDNERSIAAKLRQDYAEAAVLEKEAGLLQYSLINYSPRGYELIDDADEMALVMKQRYSPVPTEFMPSSQKRKFLTNEEAERNGFVPELNAAALYAQRMLISRRGLAVQQFRDSVEQMYGTLSTKGTFANTGIMPSTLVKEGAIPKAVIDDMRMIGEASYPVGMNEVYRNMLKGYDFLQRIFKRSATTVRPSFAAKQLVSNSFQAAMVAGWRSFKALDPRVAIDAAFLLGHRGLPTTIVPDYLSNWMGKTFGADEQILAMRSALAKITGDDQLRDYAKDIKIRTVLGQQISGTEAVQLARENGIFRGMDATGEEFTRKVAREVTRDKNTYGNVAGQLAKVWNHAGIMEDYGRMALFTNGLRMGYSAKQSAEMVNKALFDYSRALSNFESKVMRRIIPFYTFQRFAIPFVLKSAMNQPGNITSTEKFVKLLEKLLVTGDPINPAEAQTFGDSYLVEQPGIASGFDKSGKLTFNILNNITPLDVLNFMVFDKKGDVDFERTAEKSVLGAITPFLKVPLQALMKKDFFTGQALDKAQALGDMDGSLGRFIPDQLKPLIGYETVVNHATGKVNTYVNPFLSYYSLQFVPALRDIVRPMQDVQLADSTLAAVLGAMKMITLEATIPIKQKQVDLRAQEDFSQLRTLREVDDMLLELDRAASKRTKDNRDTTEYERRFEELQQYFRVLEEKGKVSAGFNIRGLGIGGQPSEPPSPPNPPNIQEFK